MNRLRGALIAGGLMLAMPGLAQAQTRDWDFCEKLGRVLAASNEFEPFGTILIDPAKPRGYTQLVMPGFDRCYVGRMGAEPPGIPTYSCRKGPAPDDLSARSLMQKVGVCLERRPEFDDNGLAYFNLAPVHLRFEETAQGPDRVVIFKAEVHRNEPRPDLSEDVPKGDPEVAAPAEEVPGEPAPADPAVSISDPYAAPDAEALPPEDPQA